MSENRGVAIAYNGVVIHDRADTLSLTDMWKAAGSPSGRAPSDWLALDATKDFVAVVEASHNAGKSGIMAKKGKGGGTYAHWQIALAYAKYLSPEFHMWCNSVVRERMEGRSVSTEVALNREAKAAVGSIVKGCARVVIREEFAALVADMLPKLVEDALLRGGHVVSVDYKPALAILKEKKIPPKGRRGLVNRIVPRLIRHSLMMEKPPRTSAETGRYLFHVDVIRDWLRREGEGIIATAVAKSAGQGVLPFIPRSAQPASDHCERN